MNATSQTSQRWNPTDLGPRQAKDLVKALGAVRWAAKTQPGSVAGMDVVGICGDPSESGAAEIQALGDRHSWTASKATLPAILADCAETKTRILQTMEAAANLAEHAPGTRCVFRWGQGCGESECVVTGHSRERGYDLVETEPHPGRRHDTRKIHPQNSRHGVGCYLSGEPAVDADEVLRLRDLAAAVDAKREADRKAREAEADAEREAGTAWLAANRPAWAKALIVAELYQDESDPMTDYFGRACLERVPLAWSRHKRDLFPEMRQAAARFDQTRHLTDGPESLEHREKYSMGAGYYLGTSCYSGWNVSKLRDYGKGFDPRLFATPERRAVIEQATPAALSAGPAPGGPAAITRNEEKDGIEIRFPAKPPAATLAGLKAAGWRWSRAGACWYKRQAPGVEEEARRLSE